MPRAPWRLRFARQVYDLSGNTLPLATPVQESVALYLHRCCLQQRRRGMEEKNQGEGNREADRRYRRGVRETVEETTEEERARRARDLPPDEQAAARAAEEQGKAKKRPAASEHEI